MYRTKIWGLCIAAALCFATLISAVPSNGQLMLLTGAGKGSAGAASCSFPTLPGLQGRWNALNVTTSAGHVVTATDLSGNSHTMLPTNTVPLNPTGYNSKPAFDFKAANTAALSATLIPMGTTQFGYAYFVGQMLTATTSFGATIVYGAIGQNDFNGANSAAFFTRNSGANSLTGSSGAIFNPYTFAVSLATNYRVVMVLDNTAGTSTTSVYVNNVLATTSAANGNPWANAGTAVIGARYSSGVDVGQSWEGPITEAGLGNALPSTTDLNNLDTFLTCQYGP